MIIPFVIELYMDLLPKNWYAFQSIIQKERRDIKFHLEKENSNESFMTMFSWWHQQFPVFRTKLSKRVPARRGKDWQNITVFLYQIVPWLSASVTTLRESFSHVTLPSCPQRFSFGTWTKSSHLELAETFIKWPGKILSRIHSLGNFL